jgi:hypothetical protein
MQIILKTFDGQKKEMIVEPLYSVKQVKTIISEQTGIYIEQIRLLYCGKTMVDTQTISDYEVSSGSIIHLMMQMKGG